MQVPSMLSEFAISKMSREFGHSVTAYNYYQLILSYECGRRRLHRTISEIRIRNSLEYGACWHSPTKKNAFVACQTFGWPKHLVKCKFGFERASATHKIHFHRTGYCYSFVCPHTNAFWMCEHQRHTADSRRWKRDSNVHSIYLFQSFTTDPTTIFTSHR